jgi:SPFH domain / Band 7 family
VSAIRIMFFVSVAVGLTLYLYYPDRWLLIVICELVASLIFFLLTMRPIHEPDRAIVFRLARFHHVAGPGYVFLMPTVDHIAGLLDMGPREFPVDVPGARTFDNEHMRTNLEVTWRIHPKVQGHVNSRIKAMVLMGLNQGESPAEQEKLQEKLRQKLIEEVVIRMARQIVSGYTKEHLAIPTNREAAAATMEDAVNEVVEHDGLHVDRIFWRGTPFPVKLLEAQLESAIRLEHAESLIKTVEAIKKRLPDMQPEEFLALQAWLDTFRRGGTSGPGNPPAPSH